MNALEEVHTHWLADLRARADRHSLVFLQLGAAFEPFRDSLSAGAFELESLTDYANDKSPRVGPIAILDVEMAGMSAPPVTMSVVRDRVNADIENGAKIVLVSRWPRIAFPDVPGSSILEDARFMHGPLLENSATENPSHILPACREKGRDLTELLCEALAEVGIEVCASLDRALFESMLISGDEALSVLSAREFEALEGAGIARVVDHNRAWSVNQRLRELRESLAATLAAHVATPRDLHSAVEGLWTIERSVRRAVRARAVEHWGAKWRQQVLNGDLGDRVLVRATESAYAAAKSLAELRDPLEWLTLGELLGIRERPEIGDLGVESYLWKQFAATILPIRNRLTHMRLLQPQDSTEVNKWRRVLDRKLITDRSTTAAQSAS